MSVDKRGIQQSTEVTRTRADPANLCATNFGRFEGIASAMESGVWRKSKMRVENKRHTNPHLPLTSHSPIGVSIPPSSAIAHFANKNAAICVVLLVLSNYRLFKLILTIIVGGSPIVGAERMRVDRSSSHAGKYRAPSDSRRILAVTPANATGSNVGQQSYESRRQILWTGLSYYWRVKT